MPGVGAVRKYKILSYLEPQYIKKLAALDLALFEANLMVCSAIIRHAAVRRKHDVRMTHFQVDGTASLHEGHRADSLFRVPPSLLLRQQPVLASMSGRPRLLPMPSASC
jgi:hypothetical protein